MNTPGARKAVVALACASALGSGCSLQTVQEDFSFSSIVSSLPSFFNSTSQEPGSSVGEVSLVTSLPLDEVPPGAAIVPAPPAPDVAIAEPDPVQPTRHASVVGLAASSDPAPVEERAQPGAETRTVAATATPARAEDFDDVWKRIRAGLSMGDTQRPEVRPHIEWLRKRPGYFKRISARARPYLHYIVEQVQKRGMPAEMALVPIVESGFQPFAYSGSGAAGLWQIIPSTGRHLGLKQNWWYDGRRDVIQATDAALDYLSNLHGRFNDWELAFAAYNAGSGTIKRAQGKSKARGTGSDFWAIRDLLPKETRGYVPRLIAIAAVLENPSAMGITLPSVPNRPYFRTVKLASQLDLGVAARAAGMKREELLALNPGFKRWATDPDGPHRLLIPRSKARAFSTRVAELPAEQRVTWRMHTIAEGETLGQIARAYGTRVDVLKKVNKLGNNRIRAGKNLMVPGASDSTTRVADSRRKASSGTTKPASRTAAETRKRAPEGMQWHTVQAGESLWSIARQYKTRVGQLTKSNRIGKSGVLRPGQRILVPARGAGTVAVSTTREHRIYTVRPGDSLWSISRRVGVGMNDLRDWNALDTGTTLKPGQRLRLSPPESRKPS